MKKSTLLGFIFSSGSLLLFSCNNDLEINATAKETMIVYGLLDPTQDTHDLKINKTFLPLSDANTAAGLSESTQYGDVLDVKVYAYDATNTVKDSLLFQRIMVSKDDGLFPTTQPIYRHIEAPNKNLNPNYTYKLKVKNTQTGTSIEGTTPIIGSLLLSNPDPEPFITSVNWVNPNSFYNLKFNTAKNGKFYALKFRFHYKEVINGTTDTLPKFIDWNLQTLRSSGLAGSEPQEVALQGQRFLSTCKALIPEKVNVKRYSGKLDLYISVATEDLDTYMSANAPSTTPVQDKPSFSNIQNGLGIFSSRMTYIRKNIGLSGSTINLLRTHDDTKNLNFQN